MKRKVRILKLARNDLKDAVNYLSGFGENPPKRFRESFEKFTGQVTEMPVMFPVYEFNPNYRRAVILYDFLIFYRYNEQQNIIEIFRVLHSSRDVRSIV